MTAYDREALEMAAEIAKSNVGEDIEEIGELVNHLNDTPETKGVFLAVKLPLTDGDGAHVGDLVLDDKEWVFELPARKSSRRDDDEDERPSRNRRDDDEDDRPRRRR